MHHIKKFVMVLLLCTTIVPMFAIEIGREEHAIQEGSASIENNAELNKPSETLQQNIAQEKDARNNTPCSPGFNRLCLVSVIAYITLPFCASFIEHVVNTPPNLNFITQNLVMRSLW